MFKAYFPQFFSSGHFPSPGHTNVISSGVVLGAHLNCLNKENKQTLFLLKKNEILIQF